MLKLEQAHNWTPPVHRWPCRGPEFFAFPEKGHATTGPTSGWVLRDIMGVRWGLCERCARKYGVLY